MNPDCRSQGFSWRGRVTILFAVFSFFASCLKSAALNPVSPFLQRSWQTDHGLPHNIVNAIVQTRDGYLWVGTRRGVARFDGMRFSILDIPEIKIQNITALCEDREGALWIATEGGVFRRTEDSLTHYEKEQGLADNNVRALCATRDGSIWFGTANGLTRFKDGHIENFDEPGGPAHKIIRSMSEDRNGALWVATDGGLYLCKDSILSIPDFVGEPGHGTRSVYVDPDGNLWVGTQGGLFRRRNDRWDHFSKESGTLSDDFVSTIYSDQGGGLWVGTYGGLNTLRDGRFRTVMTGEGTAFDLVGGICEDREGNIWVGSKDGLTRLKRRLFTPIAKPHGLTYNNVMSVLEDKAGTFWCGTWGGGLFQIKTADGEQVTLTNTVPNSRILSLCEGDDGSIWFGTDHGGGLFRLRDGELTHYDDKDDLEKTGIPVLYKDRAGNIWIGTSRSLHVFKEGEFIPYKDNFIVSGVKVILEDSEGSIWIGTNSGLSRHRKGEVTHFSSTNGLSHDMVFALYEDREKNLWIGTAAGGLNRMRNGRITAYTHLDGLFSHEVLEILEDNHGDLWMSCLKGIFRVSKRDLDLFDRKEITTIPCTSYGKDDGMLSVICSNVAKPGAWKGRDGRLWFATTKGLVVTDPKVPLQKTPPPVVIEEVIADKKNVYQPSGELLANAVVSGGSRSHQGIRIPPGRRELEIRYTALNFQAPEKIRFKYKLAGVDPDWVEADTRRVAYYNNIEPGNYTFEVVASNNDNVWHDVGARVQFAFLPHYWETTWFKISLTIFALCFAGAGARFLTQKRMQSKLLRLEQQHAIDRERTRIAQDMHDDLGVRLSEILLLSNMADKEARAEEQKQLNRKISDTARELVDNLDAIVWAVNPRNDSLETFVHYLFEYAPRYLKMSDIRCLFDSPMNLPDYPLASEVRHNLFLVVKESLYNVIKHAAASEVTIQVAIEDGLLIVGIRDNGQGFAAKADSAFGNGLLNMRQRMERIGGSFKLSSVPGKGTCIHLEIPVKNMTSTQ